MKKYFLFTIISCMFFSLTLLAQAPNEFLMFQYEGGYFKKSGTEWSQYVKRDVVATFTQAEETSTFYLLKDEAGKVLVRIPVEAQKSYQTRETENGAWKDVALITGIHRAISMTDAKKNAQQQTEKKEAEEGVKVAIGDKYIEITSTDVNGEKVSLSSFVGKGYVLVDFWASWCGPCMGEVPYLIEAYANYHEKGFEIFGVSLDTKKENWVNAINAKKMNWIQVSDVAGWKDMNVPNYGVRGIPANFLISPDGKVVAKNLRGAQLQKMLAELLDK